VLKKRIIFTLLYDNGSFMMSRNFRLQRVGDLNWLKKNYNFSLISFYIDELVVLDVSRGARNAELFCATLKELAEESFVPIAAGGGVNSVDYARKLLRFGADKVVINTIIFTQPVLVEDLAREFGRQCLVASVDLKLSAVSGNYEAWTKSGAERVLEGLPQILNCLSQMQVGEIYLNSIEKDGTGQGFDFNLLDLIPYDFPLPIILAGGAGNARHLALGLEDARVDAVATANLFNFVGDGLEKARTLLLEQDIRLAKWSNIEDLRIHGEK
jgi:cyclase